MSTVDSAIALPLLNPIQLPTGVVRANLTLSPSQQQSAPDIRLLRNRPGILRNSQAPPQVSCAITIVIHTAERRAIWISRAVARVQRCSITANKAEQLSKSVHRSRCVPVSRQRVRDVETRGSPGERNKEVAQMREHGALQLIILHECSTAMSMPSQTFRKWTRRIHPRPCVLGSTSPKFKSCQNMQTQCG